MDKKKTNSTDVGKRINDTKKEIAQLSEELEKLINSNVSKGHHSSDELKKSLGEDILLMAVPNKYGKSIETSNITNVNAGIVLKKTTLGIAPMKSVKDVNDISESLCKKNKNYDKEAAKEFIRQQREKREEQRKKINSKSKIDLELKKQKLFELQQKSLALVQRNIQLKRERSRSRENREQIRIDRNSVIKSGSSLGRKSSNITLNRKTSTISKSPNCIYSRSPKCKTIEEKCNTTNVPTSTTRLNEYTENSSHRLEVPSLSNKNGSRGRAPLRNITFRSENFPSTSTLCNVDQDLAASKIQAYFRGYRLRKQMKEDLKARTERCVLTDNCKKESKETQTSLQQPHMKTPVWLQVPPSDPYPCNFINTIKRKLQFVVNSPGNSRDIGIQSSVVATSSHDNMPKNELRKNLQHNINSYEKNELDSFVSHRCLDADALQHLAIVHGENRPEKNEQLKTDSESDTSKNIPEISSESGSASIHNVKSISTGERNSNFLLINTDKIKNLRLRNPVEKNKQSKTLDKVLSTKRGYVEEHKPFSKKSYTFNFDDELKTDNSDLSPTASQIDKMSNAKNKSSPKDSISFSSPTASQNDEKGEKFLSSPRDSILSFNRSGYHDSAQFLSIPENNLVLELTSDEIKTDITTDPAVNIGTKQSKREELLASRESMQSFNQCDFGQQNSSNNIPNSLRSLKNNSPSVIVKNIENSINTSLISHVSNNGSDIDHHSSHQSKYTNILSSSQGSVMNKHRSIAETSKVSTDLLNEQNMPQKTLAKKNIPSPATIPENFLNLDSGRISNSSKSFIPSEIENNDTRSFDGNKIGILKSTTVSEESQLSNSKISTEVLNTELSEKKNKDSKHTTVSEKMEYVSLYSTNFSSDKTDNDELSKSKDNSQKNQSLPSEKNSSSKNDGPAIASNGGNDWEEDNMNILTIDNNVVPVKNINSSVIRSKADMNEIHLKFEAEVHLLNDFNESLKQFMAVEKAFETIKNKNESTIKFQGHNTRTSKSSTGLIFSEDSKISADLSKSIISSINISRGSDIDSHFSQESLRKPWKTMDNSTGLEISNVGKEDSNTSFSETMPNNLAGLVFEQLIKDEDARIENLKTIIKIREQALLDRTKGELAWLEIQRKHLKETGKLHEASLVKKKQRGILLKHQQESREMQRLKQLQKIQSNERKTILKEQRNLIKAKLTSEKTMSELKIHTPRKQKTSGPMRVLKSSESIHSETSVSKKASDGEEIFSITSRSRSIRLSEIESSSELMISKDEKDIRINRDSKNLTDMKKALLVRQAALMKRRKAVEDLLQRHQKLLEEEKKIEELEMAANAIIMQMPTVNSAKPAAVTKLKVKGQHLNDLWQKTGASTEKKFLDNKTYCLSQSSYKKLHAAAGDYLLKHKKPNVAPTSNNLSVAKISRSSDSEGANNHSISGIITETEESKRDKIHSSEISINSVSKERSLEYSTDFELDTQDIDHDLVPDMKENNLSSISELIQDFSKIEHGISMLSKQFEPESSKTSTSSEIISESVKDSSVIETNRTLQTNQTEGYSLVDKEKSIIPTEISKSADHISINSKATTKNDTLESLKDEDISVIIHRMIPSSTTSESSLNLGELEEENHSESITKSCVFEEGKGHSLDQGSSERKPDVSKDIDSVEHEKNSTKENNEVVSFEETLYSLKIIPSQDSQHSIETVNEGETAKRNDESSNSISNIISEQKIMLADEVSRREVLRTDNSIEDSKEPSNDCNEKVEKTENVTQSEKDPYTEEVLSEASVSEFLMTEENELNNTHNTTSKENNIETADEFTFADVPSELHSKEIPSNTEEIINSNSMIETHDSPVAEVVFADPLSENVCFVLERISNDSVDENAGKEKMRKDRIPYRISEDVRDEISNIEENLELPSTDNISSNLIKDIQVENNALENQSSLNILQYDQISSTDISNEVNFNDTKNFCASEEVDDDAASNDEKYEGIAKLFRNDLQSEINESTNKSLVDESSTDVSERLSLNSGNLKISKASQGDSSSDNYSDDFEDDKEEDSTIQNQLNEKSDDTERTALGIEAAKLKSKKSPNLEENDVLMVKIDLVQSENEANIVIMQEDYHCSEEKASDQSAAEIIESINNISTTHTNDNKIIEKTSSIEMESIQFSPNRQHEGDIPKQQATDVKKRVLEILANTLDSPKTNKEANIFHQDYYVTTYEDITPTNSPESVSPVKPTPLASISIFGNEAEELRKKQLAIEQEIKHLEQQQKEQVPFVYMREIPNKPPPPYTPPSTLSTPALTILPSKVEDLNEICNYSSKVLYNAYLSNNLNDVTFSETHFKSINQTKSTNECCLFVFDLCREVAKSHYKRFEKQNVPSWLKLPEDSRLVLGKPFDYCQLEKHINSKVKELLGFEKPNIRENSIIKWSRKKKDHVDEILILESQAEEHEWLNYDKDELMVKNEVTNEILDILLSDTVGVFRRIFS